MSNSDLFAVDVDLDVQRRDCVCGSLLDMMTKCRGVQCLDAN
ncbi:hypothetical protein LHK_00859 [Laribacter hongkongensis HLHK9]|uniref:Uncharacterized protein n=1 Tax=Laribacter hongkongensis (strain HLHK9) TaxID=557598 RepID=C1D535_LARHH|nr:hypothetical protein LHK_00859 [Laribacter hongkongensis HLHK9]